MSSKNTAFTPNPDLTAQITGSGNGVPGTVAATYVASGTTDVTAILAYSRYVEITTATGNSTVATSGTYPKGARVAFQIFNDAGGARTITFGTGFRATATVVGTASKVILVEFVSDGTTLNELARSASAIT
jgi:hypothetical protein